MKKFEILTHNPEGRLYLRSKLTITPGRVSIKLGTLNEDVEEKRFMLECFEKIAEDLYGTEQSLRGTWNKLSDEISTFGRYSITMKSSEKGGNKKIKKLFIFEK